MAEAEFDRYVDDYQRLVTEALAVSGETGEYFARQRLTHLAAALARLGHAPGRVLDYGCGSGTTTALLLDVLRAAAVTGVDPSARSLDLARRAHGSRADFVGLDAFRPAGEFDTAYCSAVFHHVPPPDRPAAAALLHRSLRPGGVLSLWEHNPWSPGARWVMHRCPFDAGCRMVWPATARRMLRDTGFEVLRTEFLFIFPRALRRLRPLERALTRLPLGAQYHVLCRK